MGRVECSGIIVTLTYIYLPDSSLDYVFFSTTVHEDQIDLSRIVQKHVVKTTVTYSGTTETTETLHDFQGNLVPSVILVNDHLFGVAHAVDLSPVVNGRLSSAYLPCYLPRPIGGNQPIP